MNAAEFLDKNRIDSIQIDSKGNIEDVVSVKSLGEWAWSRISKDKGVLKSNNINFRLRFLNQNNMDCASIAVACLGEKEIKKRVSHSNQRVR